MVSGLRTAIRAIGMSVFALTLLMHSWFMHHHVSARKGAGVHDGFAGAFQ